MLKLLKAIDAFTNCLGRSIAWLALGMVLLQFSVVVLRYFLLGSIALQESVVYLHAALFMLACGYALQQDAHVRVDIFYQHFGPRTKAWINLLGSLLLLIPVALLIAYVSWDYVSAAWLSWEKSREAGGLPLVWALKTLILLLPLSLLLQGIAEILRACLLLRGEAAPQPSQQSPNTEQAAL